MKKIKYSVIITMLLISFCGNNTEEINDVTDALPNTIKGVNTKNLISLSKGKNGPGGFTADYDLVTRLWP